MKGLLSHQENSLGNRLVVSAWVSIVTVCMSVCFSLCLRVKEPGVVGPHPGTVSHPGPVLPPAVAGHDQARDQPPELGLGRGQGQGHRGVLHPLEPLLPGGDQQAAVNKGNVRQSLLPGTELQLKLEIKIFSV